MQVQAYAIAIGRCTATNPYPPLPTGSLAALKG